MKTNNYLKKIPLAQFKVSLKIKNEIIRLAKNHLIMKIILK